MPIKKTKSKGLGAQLRDYMSTVSIDLFGYEEKIRSQLTLYFDAISKVEHIPVSFLSVHLNPNPITAQLYYQDHYLREIPPSELVKFFTGAEHISGLEEKVKTGIQSYVNQYAFEKKLTQSELNICIRIADKKVNIQVLYQSQVVEIIPLKTLLKQIKP